MPVSIEPILNIAPVVAGDLTTIPPDLPKGHWRGTVTVTCTTSKKNDPSATHHPMLELAWSVTEAYDDENSDYVGACAKSWLTIYPQHHKTAAMSKRNFKQIVDHTHAPNPDASSLEESPPTWASLAPFIDHLESGEWEFWTYLKEDNRNPGQMSTNIAFSPPKGQESNGHVAVAPKTGKRRMA